MHATQKRETVHAWDWTTEKFLHDSSNSLLEVSENNTFITDMS